MFTALTSLASQCPPGNQSSVQPPYLSHFFWSHLFMSWWSELMLYTVKYCSALEWALSTTLEWLCVGYAPQVYHLLLRCLVIMKAQSYKGPCSKTGNSQGNWPFGCLSLSRLAVTLRIDCERRRVSFLCMLPCKWDCFQLEVIYLKSKTYKCAWLRTQSHVFFPPKLDCNYA